MRDLEHHERLESDGGIGGLSHLRPQSSAETFQFHPQLIRNEGEEGLG